MEAEGMSCFHAVRPCHAVTRAKINMSAFINKAPRVCRPQPLSPSVKRVVTFRAQVGNHSGEPENKTMVDQDLAPQHTKLDVPMVRMPDFWPHAATCWFTILEAQFKLHRITRQDLQYAILGQWLTGEVAIEVSDVILGPPPKHLTVT